MGTPLFDVTFHCPGASGHSAPTAALTRHAGEEAPVNRNRGGKASTGLPGHGTGMAEQSRADAAEVSSGRIIVAPPGDTQPC